MKPSGPKAVLEALAARLEQIAGIECVQLRSIHTMFLLPLKSVSTGICLERTSERLNYDVNIFSFPWYVPIPYIYFSFGDRLPLPGRGAGASLDFADEDTPDLVIDYLLSKEIPRYRRCEELQEFACYVVKRHELRIGRIRWDNVLYAEPWAYTLVLQGDELRARAVLREVAAFATTREDEYTRTARRCELIEGLLRESRSAALDQLLKWQMETQAAIGIPNHQMLREIR